MPASALYPVGGCTIRWTAAQLHPSGNAAATAGTSWGARARYTDTGWVTPGGGNRFSRAPLFCPH